jgi:hypothetical protein
LIAQDCAQPAQESLFGKSLMDGGQLPVCPTVVVLDKRHDNESVTPMLGLAQLPPPKLFVQSCWLLPQLLDPGKQLRPGALHVLPVIAPQKHMEHAAGPAGPVKSVSGFVPSLQGIGAGGAPAP